MSDFSRENAVDFWQRADQQYGIDQPGPFKESVDTLNQALETYHGQLDKDVIDGDSVLRTPSVQFKYQRGDGKPHNSSQAKAFAFTEAKTGNTYLAIDEDISNPEMFRFKVDSNGLLVNIDNTSDQFGASPEDIRLVNIAVKEISKSLSYRESSERWRKQETRKRIYTAAGIIATIGVVGGGVAFGFEKLYFEPHARDKAARIAYDKEQHVLPVEGVVLQSQKISVMPEAEFNNIPTFKNHDDLRSPRTISVEGNSCEVRTVNSHPGDTLLIALQDGDPLIGSTVGAAVDSKRKHVTICLMGPESPGQDSKSGPEESELALQLIPAKS